MKGYNCQCMICGHINRSVYLEETDGSMECEECGAAFTFTKPYQDITYGKEDRAAFVGMLLSSTENEELREILLPYAS